MIEQTLHVGHLHPLVVHLPIGILLIGFLLEIVYRKKPSNSIKDVIAVVLLIGTISAIISLGTGWILGDNGAYDETLLFRHRWLAVAFTLLSASLYMLKKSKSTISKQLYAPLYVIVLIIMGLTGHFGGSMTHGEDYLFVDKTSKKVVIEDVDKARVYADIIQPIFDNKCIGCHNPSKIKGGLLMNTKENLILGGDSGSILDSVSNNDPSLLMKHLHLPLEDEDHMPPKGKAQTTSDQLALIHWWMEHNNCFDCFVGELDKSDKLNKILENLEEDTSPRALIAKEVGAVPQDWITARNSGNISVAKLAADNPLLIVSLYGRKDIVMQDFKALRKYAKNIVELNLGNTNFNDSLSKALKSFKNLTKLQLQHTQITDKTVESIRELEHLESLNLYADSISNASLKILASLPNLKKVYLWQTNIAQNAMDDFANTYPGIKVQGQIDSDIFRATKLEPPTIIADGVFFKDSLLIAMEYVFDHAKIFYTIDGSNPDSTSLRYSKPFLITQSTEVKARTHAKGWDLSEISTSNFKKIAFDLSSISLNKNPSERYKGQGGNTLIDQKKGTINFVDGNWLGYENSHFTATIQLKNEQLVSSVSIGAFSSPEKWIFYPTGFNIWVSNNGITFKLLKSESIAPEKINTETKFRFFDLDIPPTKVKYVKVQVKSQLKNPSWHPNPGGNSWLFVDEIVLN